MATEIIPRLFLGTREDAEALGTRVPDDWACISVTEYRSRYKRKEELPREPVGSLDMPFMADWPDGWHADPHKLDLIAEIIEWKLESGKKVLVHCIHAQERAPLATAWYLAWCGDAPSLDRAYETVARLHPRTERRDKWLRGATPKGRLTEGLLRQQLREAGPEALGALFELLAAARELAGDPKSLPTLETAALAWAKAARPT